ncbi:MAG: pseudaminic acid synthase [Gammaproteobacteria bacterium]|nr:MAG: pseudaminic acid synthase [Gammaproteobacteria bacterium]
MLDGRPLGPDHPPYVIAELSANHLGDFKRACAIVRAAAASGAAALKLQSYTPDSITIDCDRPEFRVTRGPRAGATLYQVYSEGSTPWEWHAPLFELGRELGLTVFSSPFDRRAVDALERLDAPLYKIASCELVDLPLIRHVAQTGKPMILSTGMATVEEIGEALAAAREAGARDLVLLHCISGYPTPVEETNLLTIPDLAERYGVPVGFSDHTEGVAVSLAAVALGACVLERHLTLRRADGGLDAGFSLEPEELARLVQEAEFVWRARGQVCYGPLPSEAHAYRNRRSLYVVEDIPAGGVLNKENVRSIRPGAGLAPRHLPEVLGRRVKQAVARGTPLSWELLE